MSQSHGLPAGVSIFERGWLSSNNILCVGPQRTTLIDSGYVTHASQTLALVAHTLRERPLDELVNTHLHSDHCGGNAALQARYPALRISIPAAEAQAVACWDLDRLSFKATGQDCAPFVFSDVLRSGQLLPAGAHQWEVHAAPGHDPHSVILFEAASRTLVSADALWEFGYGVVFPELIGEGGFDEVAATLDQIEQLNPAIVVPGHGSVFHDVASALLVARRRLQRQAANPERHARHAAKVLLKFKLLEWGTVERAALDQWCVSTPYFETIEQRFFSGQTVAMLCSELLDELVNSGAASISGTLVRNI